MKRTILITGGTGKVGLQLLAHFFKNGDRVITTSRSELALRKLQKKLGNSLVGIQIDLQQPNSAEKVMAQLKKMKLKPQVLINAARDVSHLRTDDQLVLTREKWLNEFLLDVVVPYELSLHLATQKGSALKTIINLSSIYGMVAQNPQLYENPARSLSPNYGVSKAAVIQLTKDLAVQLAPQHIQVNCVSYGGIKGRVDDEFFKRYARLVPTGKMLEEKEVVGAVAFLSSPAASSITGHNLIVDGGWTIW